MTNYQSFFAVGDAVSFRSMTPGSLSSSTEQTGNIVSVTFTASSTFYDIYAAQRASLFMRVPITDLYKNGSGLPTKVDAPMDAAVSGWIKNPR